MTGPEPGTYRAEHARERLAGDPRIAALDLDVRIVDTRVFLSGTVSTDAQRVLAAAVVTEVLPELELHNELVVAECREASPTAPERIV